MIWKIAGLGILALFVLIAIALVYPGIPFGVDLTSNNKKVVLTCSYLHWDGVHRKTVTIPNPSGVYTLTRSDCPR